MERTPAREESIERVDAYADKLVDEVLRGNLLLPLTYSSINVHGALVFLEASLEEINPDSILASFDKNIGKHSKHAFDMANTAHAAKDFTLESRGNKRNSVEDIAMLLGGHVTSALQTGKLYVRTCTQHENVTTDDGELLNDNMAAIKSALYDQSIRPMLREYAQQIAEDPAQSKDIYDQISTQWSLVYAESQAYKDMCTKLRDPDFVMYVFDLATSPKSRMGESG